ncbi:hypothetical protein DFH28DRAFT_274374 [Melampsora americana]|nr:hypothetical protein DFH28DRAFT_274374 [Melampsora americana]
MLLSALKSNILCVLLLGVNLAQGLGVQDLEHRSTLVRRRMGVQNDFPKVDDCPQDLCGNLLYSTGQTLFAMQDPCAAQRHADKLLDVAENPKLTNAKTKEQLTALAKALCSAEKNTPDDWSKSPATKLNALYCHEKPKHSILNGLFFKQAPDNDPNFFFDPRGKDRKGRTVKLDEIPETRPLNSGKNATQSKN